MNSVRGGLVNAGELRVQSGHALALRASAKTSHAKMASGMAEISLDKESTLRPNKAVPVVVKNLQYWFTNSNDGFVLAYSTHHFDGEKKFSETKKNGFNITWNVKGDIKPASAKAAMLRP